MSLYTVVALDLEGTLISNAMSQLPRQGLHHFLELCDTHLPEVVLYTAVRETLARQVVQRLVQDGFAPSWLASITYIDWHGDHKDLSFIPGHSPEHAVLVDDQRSYVHPAQAANWIEIQEFAHPYSPDHELERVWTILQDRLAPHAHWGTPT